MGSTENFCLRWNDFESNVSGAFRDLRAEADFFDVTLSCTDSNGRSLQAHKVILSACSSFFKSLLRQQQASLNSHPNPFIYLRGVTFSDLSSVLDFMYHGEVNVAQEDLNSFLSVAEELQIKGLTNKDGRSSSGEPSKDKRSYPGSGRPAGGAPPHKRLRRSSVTPNPTTSGLHSAKLDPSSDDIRPADIKSDPESLKAGPSSSGQLQSGGQAVTDFEDGDNPGELDGSYSDDYYNDNGEGGDGMLNEDIASGGDASEEGAGKDSEDLWDALEKIEVPGQRWKIRCRKCGHLAKQTSHAKEHLLRKHAKPVFMPCPFCGRVCNNLPNLRSHISGCKTQQFLNRQEHPLPLVVTNKKAAHQDGV